MSDITASARVQDIAARPAIRGAECKVRMRTVMLDIPYGERDNYPSLTPYQYGELARILRDTAHMIGVEPRTFQATVWIHARGKVD